MVVVPTYGLTKKHVYGQCDLFLGRRFNSGQVHPNTPFFIFFYGYKCNGLFIYGRIFFAEMDGFLRVLGR